VGMVIEKRNLKFLRFWGLGFCEGFGGLVVGLDEFEGLESCLSMYKCWVEGFWWCLCC
jgi:hypothetical protein